MAAITYTSGRTDGAQEFTSERAALLAAIDKFQGRKLRSTVIEKADYYFQQTLKEMEVNQSDDPDSTGRRRSRGQFAGRTAIRTSRPIPTTSNEVTAPSKCWAPWESLPTSWEASADGARRS